MFLPKYLYQLLENARLKSDDSKLISTSKTLNPSNATAQNNFFSSPFFILGILAFIMLLVTYKDYKNKTRSKWLDISLFAFTGVIGVVLLLLWVATDHQTTAYNYNLLWACAFNLLFIPSIYKSKLNNRGLSYLKFLVLLLCLMGLHWITGVQSFAISLIPLLIAIGVRYLFLIHHFKTAIRV